MQKQGRTPENSNLNIADENPVPPVTQYSGRWDLLSFFIANQSPALQLHYSMRCYYGAIPRSDYFARYGYYEEDYNKLRRENPDIHITWFPLEKYYIASYTLDSGKPVTYDLSRPHSDKMACLKEALKRIPRTNLHPLSIN